MRPPAQFTHLEALQHRLRGRRSGVYTYSFSLEPRHQQPAGALATCRASRTCASLDEGEVKGAIWIGEMSNIFFSFLYLRRVLREDASLLNKSRPRGPRESAFGFVILPPFPPHVASLLAAVLLIRPLMKTKNKYNKYEIWTFRRLGVVHGCPGELILKRKCTFAPL